MTTNKYVICKNPSTKNILSQIIIFIYFFLTANSPEIEQCISSCVFLYFSVC